MTKRHLSDDEVDALLFASLQDEEEAVPSSVQGTLAARLHRQKAGWRPLWWLPAAIGVLQTTAFVGIIQLLLPGSLFSFIAMIAGGIISVSACTLSGLAHKSWKKEDALC
ncbi:MAG: hypothetical protein K0R57_2263 [Paenibacillaceae bacterium]|jgi:hypothetical protein|nr:hypothetical protein [Paenibacillaceae bacterium]